MTRIIAELLQASEPIFSITVAQLEAATGNRAVDVALTANIIETRQKKIKALGLDPADCTGHELYKALSDLVVLHDTFLARKLGVSNPSSVRKTTDKIISYIDQMDIPRDVWVMRQTVAKRIIKSLPPKKLMKRLGYRSIDSMLKREHIADIVGVGLLLENESWRIAFEKKCQQLSPIDFETRDIEVHHLCGKKWEAVAQELTDIRRHNLVAVKLLGVVLVLPLPIQYLKVVTILTTALVVHYIGELRTTSSYVRSLQVHADFGVHVSQIATQIEPLVIKVGDQEIRWATLHRYFGSFERQNHPLVFEPHVQPEDLRWLQTEEILYRIEPALHFWFETNHIGIVKNGKPVSFHLLDVIVSTLNNLQYGYQVTHHLRESLWNELILGYCALAPMESQILKQLETRSTHSDLLLLHSRKKTNYDA